MEGYLIGSNRYALQQDVRCYDVDERMRLRPSAFMDYAQQIAYLAAEAMHFGYGDLVREGKAWVLSRMHVVFDSIPAWRDSVRMVTWHKGPSGPFYLRDFSLQDLDGKPLVRATSSWVILDIKQRRMARTAEVVEMIPEDTVCHENAIEGQAPRVMLPKGAEPVLCTRRHVEYSDVDIQGHTNNARYVLWAFDCIGLDTLVNRCVKEFSVNFNHETLPGQEVELRLFQEEEEYFIEGLCEGRQVFILNTKLA